MYLDTDNNISDSYNVQNHRFLGQSQCNIHTPGHATELSQYLNALPNVRRISGVVTTATKLDLVLVVVCDLVRYFRPHAVKAS
ncbi:hypothetical protein J6590_038468 [Homalodisca vitripennis]|nr:hypothetical protein J6590_038468 [Homalodisca vitripennis]